MLKALTVLALIVTGILINGLRWRSTPLTGRYLCACGAFIVASICLAIASW